MIDHEGFPAIVDAILAASPEAAFPSWRATSRAFRDRVDAFLLAHIVLDVPRSPSGRRLSVTRGRPIRVRSASGRRLPCLAWEDPEASPAQRDAWAAAMRKHVKVVDYAAEIAFPDDDARLSSALDSVAVVRRLFVAHEVLPWRLDCWRYALPATKVVDYVRLGPSPRTSMSAPRHAPVEGAAMERTSSNESDGTDVSDGEPHPAVVLDMPPSVKSSVTVFRYDPQYTTESAYRWQFWDRSGHASFVCIFIQDGVGGGPAAGTSGTRAATGPAHAPTAAPSTTAPSTTAAPRRLTFLRPLIRALRSYAPSTRPVLVGITEIPRQAIGFAADASDDEVRNGFLEILVAECLSWEDVRPARLKRITESITFLTLAEYRDRVGRETYELEVGGKLPCKEEGPDAREVLRQLRL